jgi:uncharacterized lipoprotein YmbA
MTFNAKISAIVLLVALLAGCRSPNPALYTIAVQPGATVAAGPKNIELRDIGLAGYLDRPAIVRATDGYRLQVMANDTWGEPLGAMISRVLTEELAQRLPGSNVFGERGAISISPDATVAVNIQQMDIVSDSQLVLLAQVAIEFSRRKDTLVRTFNIVKPISAVTTSDEVAAISFAMSDLADGVAQMLRK